jgi:hypothetical protein
MEGIVAEGLAYYYKVTGYEDVLDSTVGFADWISQEEVIGIKGAPYMCMIGEDYSLGEELLPNNLPPKVRKFGGGARMPGILAWVYRHTGRQSYLEAAKRQAQAMKWKKYSLRMAALAGDVYWKEIFRRKEDRMPPIESKICAPHILEMIMCSSDGQLLETMGSLAELSFTV